MKLSRLFMLCGVLLMAGTSAKAELVNGVRQRPNVAKTETFQVDAEYYLFNTEARMFFLGANDWSTRASVGNNGYKVKIVQSEYAPEGSFEFTDSVETKRAWMCVFSASDAGAIWVDNNSETYRFWEFTEANGKYRISNNDLAGVVETVNGTFLGWNGTDDTRLYFLNPATEGVGVDWVFVTEETYWAWQETWASMQDQFEAAAELLTYLNAAQEKGINVAAETRIYQNEAATVKEINAATAAVQKKINDAQAGNATVSNPSDMTGSLLNPNFDNASSNGWMGTRPNMTGSGSHGPANVAEHFSKTFDTYQELSNMPAGVYMLENNGFHRGWWDGYVNKTGYTAFLYAYADNEFSQVAMANPWEALNEEPMSGYTDFDTYASESEGNYEGTTYYIPNDPSAARLYFEKGFYKNKVFFTVEDGSYLRVGVKKDVNQSNEWAVFDSFKLTYYGQAPEAYQYYAQNAVAKKDFSDVNVSDQYLKVYEAAFQGTATNKTEAKAVVEGIKAAEEVMATNISLWKDLKAKYEAGLQLAIDNNALVSAGELSEYLQYTVEDETGITNSAEVKTDGADLTNDQLWVMIDRINTLMAAVEKEAKENLQPGQDVTEYLVNPGFENGTTGWTVVSKGGGNVQLGGNGANHCFEAWHSTNFDVYQEVTGLPVGVYEVSVNGYVRYRDGQDAINSRADEPANVPIYVYMNDSKTNLVSWFSYPKPTSFYQEVSGASYLYEDDDNAYPDNMIAASAAFAEGGYSQTAKCLVTEAGGVTRIGVKGTPEAKFWPIFDNFKLTYLGYDIDVVKPLLEEKVAEVQKWSDVMTTKTDKATLTQALEAASVALRGNNGLAMFSSVARLEKAVNDVMEGIVLCESLLEEANVFLAYASESESPLAQQGQQLAATILSDLEECKYDEADLEVQSLAIRAMKLKMELPADYAQGSADGVDVTAFIQTPSFSKTVNWEETNSADGWQGIGGSSFGYDYEQRSALAIEFYEKSFDMYQDITGIGEVVLPKGNYRLQVNAFERVNEESPAYLYVETSAGIQQVELMKHADGFDSEAGENGPGDMISSAEMFEEGRYLNSIDFYSNGEVFRIGIKHENVYSYDWIIMDNFKLFYFGDNGQVAYSKGDVNHDGTIDVTDVVIIIDAILMKNPQNYDASLADVNGDGEVDVTDVVMVIDNILGKIELSRGATQAEKDLTAYTAFQMDLTIPAGYVLEGVELTEMAKDSHKLAYSKLDDGRCRVVVFSMDNEALPGAWDEVIRLNLKGQGDATVNVDRAMFVTVGGERHELLINGTTSIAQFSTLNSQFSIVYDLTGRKVEKTAKGVYIENGRKVVVK